MATGPRGKRSGAAGGAAAGAAARQLQPMLARDAAGPPKGAGWAFEIKWDGVRALAEIADGEARILSRRGEDITRRYPELAGLGEALAGHAAIIDGEIVALDDGGNPNFQLLQQRMGLTAELSIRRRVVEVPVTYMAFDLLRLDGRSLLAEPYEERRRLLGSLPLSGPHWRAPAHHVGDGAALLAAARERSLEGVVAKRLGSLYRPGVRTRDWLKVRIRHRQELVIGGWNPGEGGRRGRVGSLLVGYWDATPAEAERLGRSQRLVYAGAVGSGFSERSLDAVTRRLEPLRREASPFELGIGPKRRGAVFCEPELVCEVEFSEWTREGTLRAPVFKGLREDKDPRQVVREAAGSARDR